MLENREYDEIIGRPEAPYINSLATRSALALNAFAVAHPSLPNYLALTGGETFGITSDCTSCHVHAPNLVDELEGAGVSWKAYMDDMPSPCYRGAQTANYAKKHDPFMYYDDVSSNPERCSNVVPGSQLAADVGAGRLPAFVWISPNLCNDMHDCDTATGDRYLASLVPALIRELGPHGRLYLTWDEGSSDLGCCARAAGGRIAMLVAGPDIQPGARWTQSYDHYSVLRDIEDSFGLPRLGQAGCPCTNSLPRAPVSLRP